MRDAERILARMKRTKHGWGPVDFETLYLGFGFQFHEGARHRVYVHAAFPQLRATVGRHGELAPGYAQHAVKLIALLRQLTGEADESQE